MALRVNVDGNDSVIVYGPDRSPGSVGKKLNIDGLGLSLYERPLHMQGRMIGSTDLYGQRARREQAGADRFPRSLAAAAPEFGHVGKRISFASPHVEGYGNTFLQG